MRKININNPEELKRFKLETSGFVSSYGFPYRLDDVTEEGANYVLEQIEEVTNICFDEELIKVIAQLKKNNYGNN